MGPRGQTDRIGNIDPRLGRWWTGGRPIGQCWRVGGCRDTDLLHSGGWRRCALGPGWRQSHRGGWHWRGDGRPAGHGRASEGLFDQFANAADEAMAPAREVAREASEQAENLGAFTTADDELDFNLNPNWWEEIPRERRSITVMAGVGGFFIGLALGGLLTRKMQALFSAAIGAALWLEAGHTMLEIWLPTAADRVGAMEGWAAPAWAVMALLGAIIQWSPDRRKSKPEVDEKDAD